MRLYSKRSVHFQHASCSSKPCPLQSRHNSNLGWYLTARDVTTFQGHLRAERILAGSILSQWAKKHTHFCRSRAISGVATGRRKIGLIESVTQGFRDRSDRYTTVPS